QIGTEINLELADVLLARCGKSALNTGDEGGFAPAFTRPEEALECLHEAVDRSGYADRVSYGLDCAATHLYDAGAGLYTVAGESSAPHASIGASPRHNADHGALT